jgi:hypothetical protein
METLRKLDEIAREAHAGNYGRVGVLSTGERLYVAVASGRMRELVPDDSIAYAVDRIGQEWMAHMLEEWRSAQQPLDATSHNVSNGSEPPAPRYVHPNHPAIWALYVAAAARGYYLHQMPGGYFGVYKKDHDLVEPVGAWLRYKDVARICGATKELTLRGALERDGLSWPTVPEQFLEDFYANSN